MAIIIRLSPLFGTAEGWEQLREMLSKPQQVAVDVSDQLFSEINPPEVESEFLSTSAASLRVIGSSIPTNDSTVMWVKLSDPPPPPRNAVPSASQTFIHYWRNEIHATYQGTGWEPPAYSELPAADYSESEDYQFGRYRLTQEFQLVAQHDDRLFSANQPVSADPDITFAISESDQSILLQGDADSYQVESLATRLLEVQLNTAGEEYPEAILATYLQLPDSLPERVRNLAGRLVSSADSPYEKAVKIQDYLRQNYPYDLETPAPPSGRDAVDYFLFEGQSGFCTYYATAMAVLLRTQGVPARVVSGYAMGEYDQELAAYRVPASAVHAWVEVYFPRFGWVEFEPTPSQSAIQYLEGSFSVEEAGDPEAVDIRRWPLLANPMRSAGILALLIIAILGVYLLVGYFKQLPWNRTTQGKISLHYWKIRRALQNAGIRAEVTETPEEFLFINATHLSEYSKLLQALKNATSLYQQAQYSPIVPDVGAVNSAKATWRLALPDLLRLYSRSIRRHRRAV
jgi:transglutaminase-like putative cysteine protease